MDVNISIVSAAVLLDWYRRVGCIHGDCNFHPVSAVRGHFQSQLPVSPQFTATHSIDAIAIVKTIFNPEIYSSLKKK